MLFVVVVEAVVVTMGVHLILVTVFVDVDEVIRFQKLRISQNFLRESGPNNTFLSVKNVNHIRNLF